MKKIFLIIGITGFHFASAQNDKMPWLKPLPPKPEMQMKVISCMLLQAQTISCMMPTEKFDPTTPKLIPGMPYENKDIFSSPPVMSYIYIGVPCGYNIKKGIEKQIVSFSPEKFKELRDYLDGKKERFS